MTAPRYEPLMFNVPSTGQFMYSVEPDDPRADIPTPEPEEE
jgi:hypothetical protein